LSKNPTPPRHLQRVTGIDVGQGNAVTLQKSTPTQLTLWQTFLPGDPKTEDYSNTVELYDAVPKYFASKKRMAEQRQDGRFLNSLKQPFRHKGKDYVVKITPARIEEKDGSEKEYYPSWREELVEEALKKVACDQLNGVYLNGVAGVQFTLYELRKELKCRGHDMHLDDLLKSLMICRRAHIPAVSPLLTPVSSRNALLLQSLPMNTPFWQVNARRRKDDTGVDTAARGIVERLSRLPRRLPSDGGASGRVRHALCAPRQLTPYCHTSGLELEGMFQRSTVLPDVERQRGTQHDGKAESEEKVLKSSFRKTCMVR